MKPVIINFNDKNYNWEIAWQFYNWVSEYINIECPLFTNCVIDGAHADGKGIKITFNVLVYKTKDYPGEIIKTVIVSGKDEGIAIQMKKFINHINENLDKSCPKLKPYKGE